MGKKWRIEATIDNNLDPEEMPIISNCRPKATPSIMLDSIYAELHHMAPNGAGPRRLRDSHARDQGRRLESGELIVPSKQRNERTSQCRGSRDKTWSGLRRPGSGRMAYQTEPAARMGERTSNTERRGMRASLKGAPCPATGGAGESSTSCR
jgi:hypothetical protein